MRPFLPFATLATNVRFWPKADPNFSGFWGV